MNFQHFGIDKRLLDGAGSLRERGLFHEKMLHHAVEKGENVCAKIELSSGREEIYLLPALQWLAAAPAGETRKILLAAHDRATAERAAAAALGLGAGLGLETCAVTPSEDSETAGGVHAPVLEGNTGAAFVAGTPEALLAAAESGLLRLKEFGFLLVDSGERVAELAPELLRRLSDALLPSWERKTVVACSKISAKAKTFAWDFAHNPVEIQVEEEVTKAQSVASRSYRVEAADKLRFLLGLLAREGAATVAAYCNLETGAEELVLRLEANGIPAALVAGAPSPERGREILAEAAAEGIRVLVLTDEASAGMPAGAFGLVVNYDIPLEPDLYVARLAMLDREAPGAVVVNLACDRYLYGLPAIERYIDASLGAVQADASLLESVDASAGLVWRRSPGSPEGKLVPASEAGSAGGNGDGGRREGREGERRDGERRDGGRRQAPRGRESDEPRPPRAAGEEPRGGGDRGRPRRDDNRRDENKPWNSDRSPDIRRSISELTGGSLGKEGRATPPEPRAEAAGKARRDEGRREGAREGGRKPEGAERSPGSAERGGANKGGRGKGRRRGGEGRGPEGRARAGEARRSDKRRPEERVGEGMSPNPYELPMEERMRMYREKYGKGVDAGRQGKPAGGKGGGAPRDGAPRRNDQARSASPGSGRSAPRGGNEQRPPKAPPARDQAARDRGAKSEPRDRGAADKGGGLLGKIAGLFRRK